MSDWYCCGNCDTVVPLIDDRDRERAIEHAKECSCGSTNGRIISQNEFSEGFEPGVNFNRDPETGKPLKKAPS